MIDLVASHHVILVKDFVFGDYDTFFWGDCGNSNTNMLARKYLWKYLWKHYHKTVMGLRKVL